MPLAPADHLAILNLLAAYNHAIDLGDSAAWAECFTVDGEFDARPICHCHGRTELVEFAEKRGQPGGSRHWTSNVWVEGEGDQATARLYLMMLAPGNHASPGLTGVYYDNLVKVGGQWKIRYRRLVFEETPTWRQPS